MKKSTLISKQIENINKRIRGIKTKLNISVTETAYADLFSKIIYPKTSRKSGELKPISQTGLTRKEYKELFDLFKNSEIYKQTYFKDALDYKVKVGQQRIQPILDSNKEFQKKWNKLAKIQKFYALSTAGLESNAEERVTGNYGHFSHKLIQWTDRYLGGGENDDM